jgi:hypothetical protein
VSVVCLISISCVLIMNFRIYNAIITNILTSAKN